MKNAYVKVVAEQVVEHGAHKKVHIKCHHKASPLSGDV